MFVLKFESHLNKLFSFFLFLGAPTGPAYIFPHVSKCTKKLKSWRGAIFYCPGHFHPQVWPPLCPCGDFPAKPFMGQRLETFPVC